MRSLVNIFTSHDDSLSLYTRNSQIRQEKVVLGHSHTYTCAYSQKKEEVFVKIVSLRNLAGEIYRPKNRKKPQVTVRQI